MLFMLTDGQSHFATLAVKGFFVISGFLIYKSASRSNSLIHFAKKRILRIYPALVTVVVLSALLLGYWQSDLSFKGYYLHPRPWTYMVGNIQLFLSEYKPVSIHDVFASNPYPSIFNGSLWTIPFEVLFYVFTSIFCMIKKQRTKQFVIAGLLISLYLLRIFAYPYFLTQPLAIPHTHFAFHLLVDLGLFYTMGMFLACLPIAPSLLSRNKWIIVVSILLVCMWLAFHFSIYEQMQYLIVPMLVISVCINSSALARGFESLRLGDLSYGVYLWGFPIQQTLAHLGFDNLYVLMALSIPLAYLAGYLSWNLVEKRFIQRS